MKQKPWHIDRRTMLKGTGAAIALPFLEAMAFGNTSAASAAALPKKRFCTLFFPFGVTKAPEGHRHEDWSWHPKVAQDGSYEFREIMKPLNGLKNRITVVDGLHHIKEPGGHGSGDSFLTATPATGPHSKNTISLDQVVAEKYGSETRFSSMVLGLDGGIGAPGRSSTLSFRKNGSPIPAETNLRKLFDRMFSKETQQSMIAEMKRDASILDRTLESSKRLNNQLGKRDQEKLDQYLTSIRELEKRIQKQEAWMQSEVPEVDSSDMALDATLQESPAEYLQCMFDIIYLSFKTDMTRSITFQIGNQAVHGLSGKLAGSLGMKAAHHSLSHNMNKDDGTLHYGEYLKYLSGLYAKFLDRLKDTPEGSGSLLDNTLTLYGSSNGNPTHSSTNLPIIISGGESMGFRQGQYLQYGSDVPLSNLYATMLDGLGVHQESFGESNGRLGEILRG